MGGYASHAQMLRHSACGHRRPSPRSRSQLALWLYPPITFALLRAPARSSACPPPQSRTARAVPREFVRRVGHKSKGTVRVFGQLSGCHKGWVVWLLLSGKGIRSALRSTCVCATAVSIRSLEIPRSHIASAINVPAAIAARIVAVPQGLDYPLVFSLDGPFAQDVAVDLAQHADKLAVGGSVSPRRMRATICPRTAHNSSACGASNSLNAT